jgi:WD40 repeat protein
VVMVDIKPKGPQNEKGHSDLIRKILWSHDNFHIISASDDSTIKSWNVARGGSLVREFLGHTKKVNDICLDSKGSRLLSCSADGDIKIWKYATTDCIRTISGGHFGAVLAAQWTPELGGRRIISSGEDKAICVWEASTGLLMQKLENVHTGPIRSISVRPDGLAFATASTESAVGIWRAIPPSMCESCGWAMYSCGTSAMAFVQEVWTAKLPEEEEMPTSKSKDSSPSSTMASMTTATAMPSAADSASDAIGVNGSVFIPPGK